MLGGRKAWMLKRHYCAFNSQLSSLIASPPAGFSVNIGTQNVVGNQVELTILQMVVGRVGGKARVFDRSADGEMVKTLILIIF